MINFYIAASVKLHIHKREREREINESDFLRERERERVLSTVYGDFSSWKRKIEFCQKSVQESVIIY